jgi:hypothetical protein
MATTKESTDRRRATRRTSGGRSSDGERRRSSSETRERDRAGSRGRSGSNGGGGNLRITASNLRAGDRRWIEQHGAQLSPSTLRAKWIHSVDEHEDRAGQTLATREPAVIQAWAEDRDAVPATVGRRDPNERPRSLRFDFDGGRSDRLQAIDWDGWLGTFEDRDLVFLFQEHRRNGDTSNFFRLDSPDREEG